MRRTLIVSAIGLIASLGAVTAGSSRAEALSSTATCAVTNYTVNGSFNRIGGAATFSVHASGSCIGALGGLGQSVAIDLNFNSIGPWSCDAGVAHGAGGLTANNNTVFQTVDGYLVNVGGEYVIEVVGTAFNAAAAGQFTTLPIPCDEGQTQTTIGGSGTLTYAA
jgi:hypothetical protein